MFYLFVRPFARLAFYVYFRKIHILNKDLVPTQGPLIFTSNHPTAFIEPCLMACFQPRVLNFLVRGDFFRKPIYKFLLNSLNMLPIYRFSEGFAKLKDNLNTFDACTDALHANKCIMILIEGRAVLAKQLRPFQKGLARLVDAMLTKHPNSELKLVPVGFTYSEANTFRSEVIITFGKPISAAKYSSGLKTERALTITKITSDLREHIKSLMVDLQDQSRARLHEQIADLIKNEHQFSVLPLKPTSESSFIKERELAIQLNALKEIEYEQIKSDVDSYYSMIKEKGVNDYNLVHQENRLSSNIKFALLFIPGLIGKVIHYPAYFIGKYLKENKIPRPEFMAPVHLAVYLTLSFLSYSFLLVLILCCLEFQYLLLIPIIFILGMMALVKRDISHHLITLRQVGRANVEIDQLKLQRSKLINTLLKHNIRI